MKNDDIETLFDEDDEFVKDPSLDNVFPDKDDFDKDNLLSRYEDDNDSKEILDIKEEITSDVSIKKEKKPKKMKLWQKILVIFICLALILGSFLAFLLYGPYPNFRNWLITTAMTTMSHKYLATWFYDENTINGVMQENYVRESGEETDLNAISFVDYSNSNIMYKNKYEKEILTHDEGDIYKLININEDGMRGYLVAIYDASKVKLGTSSNMNS